MKYIVTNFAYGTGPYIRTTELAIAFNEALVERGKARMGIIVPWVYGKKQRRIMFEEEFKEYEKKYPGEIVLDEELGGLLRGIFYHDNTYTEALSMWVQNIDQVTDQVKQYFQGILSTQTYSGELVTIDSKDIAIELHRSPRISFDTAPAYSTTFGHISEILEKVLAVDKAGIATDRQLVKRGMHIAEKIEEKLKVCAIAYPATFSGFDDWKPKFGSEFLVPPITSQKVIADTRSLEEGVYVTITGIPGLERLYREAQELGLHLYSNDTHAVAESLKALPSIISNKNIRLQFARAGWGSIWYSMFTQTPAIVPAFDPTDDPEIYFNNQAIEALNLGIVYREQPLSEILKEGDKVVESYEKIMEEIFIKWGTGDGNRIAADTFADDYLKRYDTSSQSV